MAEFSERIRQLRSEQGMTQEALGTIIGVTRFSVYSYEKGLNYPEVRSLITLADYFGVSTDYLLGRTDNPEINR